jgi:hypothetical protein
MAGRIPNTNPLNDMEAQSTGVRPNALGGQIFNRGGSSVFDTESNELVPIMNDGIESERRSFELKRRHVQMMAFGIPSFSALT